MRPYIKKFYSSFFTYFFMYNHLLFCTIIFETPCIYIYTENVTKTIIAKMKNVIICIYTLFLYSLPINRDHSFYLYFCSININSNIVKSIETRKSLYYMRISTNKNKLRISTK